MFVIRPNAVRTPSADFLTTLFWRQILIQIHSSFTTDLLILTAPQPTDRVGNPLLLPPNLVLGLSTRIAPGINLHGIRVVGIVVSVAPSSSPGFLPLNLLTLVVEHFAPIDHFGPGFGVHAHRSVHVAGHETTALAELVDGADRVDGLVQRPARVEVLFDRRQEVLAVAVGLFRAGRILRLDPRVLEGLVGRHAGARVDRQAPFDKVSCSLRHVTPVLDRSKRVVRGEDGLHLFEIAVSVERGVAAE